MTNGWVRAVAQVGFPIAVALILLGVFVGYVPSPMTEARVTLDALSTATAAARTDQQVQTRLLRAICRNVAKGDAERVGCDQ